MADQASSCAACSGSARSTSSTSPTPPTSSSSRRDRRARGERRFVFDHHDLTPELFRSRFGRAGLAPPAAALRSSDGRCDRADVVISTNESYRRIAIERGGVSPDGRLRRSQRSRPRALHARSRRIPSFVGAGVPARLPGDDGPAGRDRPRARCPRRAAAAPGGRLARRLHRRGRGPQRDGRRSPTSWGSPSRSSSRAGAATTTSAASSRPQTSASRPIRPARSTTSRR